MHLGDQDLGLVENGTKRAFNRFSVIRWKKGGLCFETMKWCEILKTGKQTPWFPLQYNQVPIKYADRYIRMALQEQCEHCGNTYLDYDFFAGGYRASCQLCRTYSEKSPGGLP